MNSGILSAGQGRTVWVVGDHYTIKASGKDTSGAFTLIEVMVPPQSGPPPHVHRREDEAFYVLEGEFEVHIDNQRLTAGPGSWVTLPKGTLHHFKNIGPSRAKMLILATPAGLDQFFLEAGRVATDASPESGIATSNDIEKLLEIAPKYEIEIRLPQP
jgi:quercetin dioxygenase-like cupin family protein